MPLATFIDLFIIFVLGIYLIDGYRRGLLLLTLELVGTLVTFYLALRLATPVGQLIDRYIAIPDGLGKPIGFAGLWLALQGLYLIISGLLYPFIPKTIRQSPINKLLGLIPSVAKGLVMVAIILTLLVVLPVDNKWRPAILSSRLGMPIVTKTQALQQRLAQTYSKELTDTLTFLTNTPFAQRTTEPTERLTLPFKTTVVTIDSAAATKMLELINQERAKVGEGALKSNIGLRAVAEAHAKDMLARGYFSHTSLQSQDPFDRLSQVGVKYLTAGENLAFAPTVELAHVGLMNSPKHRDNILLAEFGQVGIAAVQAGFYGTMFVQVFTN